MRQWRYGDPLHVVRKVRADLRGRRFGLLTVREYVFRTGAASSWLCDCDCGQTSEVRTGDLNSGSTRSCGSTLHQLEEIVEYSAAHDRVRKAYGPASDYRCVDCGSAAEQWSYDHRDPSERLSATVKGRPPYSLKVEHYQPRCVSCHKVFDLART